jgi:hypothetical protein
MSAVGDGRPFQYDARVDQAQGMVRVQADCTLDEALRLMIDRGRVSHLSLDAIADDVVERLNRFG